MKMSKRLEVLENIKRMTNLTLRVYKQVSMERFSHSAYNIATRHVLDTINKFNAHA